MIALAFMGIGSQELILIAQDTAYYGMDNGGKSTLASLVRKLSDIEGIDSGMKRPPSSARPCLITSAESNFVFSLSRVL